MNVPNDSKMNGIVTAIGILVLVIGTATGNAYVMFTMVIAALVAVMILSKSSSSWRGVVGVTVAAVTAFAVAYGITRL